MTRLWRRFPFSVRFLLILGGTGVVIAAAALGLATREAQSSARSRSADRLSIATTLINQQRNAAAAYASASAANVSRLLAGSAPLAAVGAELSRETKLSPGDVVAYVGGASPVMMRNGQPLAAGDLPVNSLSTSVTPSMVSGGPGQWWLLASYPVSPTGRVVVAHPVTASLLTDVVVVNEGNLVLDGTVAGVPFTAGSPLPPSLLTSIGHRDGQIASFNDLTLAVASMPLDGGLELVATSRQTDAAGQGGVLLLLLLLAIALLIIVAVVQSDLQRPLRRLDRAVARLASGELDVSIPQVDTDDEIGRLASSFELMRKQLQTTLTESRARAAIATELNAAQPLQRALEKVCNELKEALGSELAMIVVGGSEMTDSFVVQSGGDGEVEADALLNTQGPVGEAFGRSSTDAITVMVPPDSVEAGWGVTTLCAAPVTMGSIRLGVIAAGRKQGRMTLGQRVLISSTAEQVALALERYRFIAVVQRQASIDDLTGLYNHRFMVDHVDQQVALAERLHTPLAVLMLDIDHFKKLNDTYGHSAGDTALQYFAATVANSVRRSDLAARYGGEEFVVIMPNTGQADAALVAEKIRAAVAKDPVVLDSRGVNARISVSIGVAAYPENTVEAHELLRLADEALYRAKDSGRDRVVIAGERTDLQKVGRSRRRAGVVAGQ